MTADAWITLVVLAATVVFLATEAIPAPMTMAGSTVVLLAAGVLDETEAFAGFSNPAPITVGALYVLAGAVDATGALRGFTDRILTAEPGRRRADLARICAPTAAASGFMANTPLVALLAPRVAAWAGRTGQPPGRYLMPVSYAAILGGLITIIGTSTNLLVSGILEEQGMEPLGFFEITPVGLAVAAVGVGVTVLFAPLLLPDRRGPADHIGDEVREFTLEMVVTADQSVAGKTVAEAGLRNLQGVFLVAIEHPDGTSVVPAGPEDALATGDRLTFLGDVKRVLDLQRLRGLELAARRHVDILETGDHRVFEVVVSERSMLVGSNIREVGFRNRFGGVVMGVHRAAHRVEGKVGDVNLRGGDVLLVVADADFGIRWKEGKDFLVVSELAEGAPPQAEKARLVELAVLALVVLSATELVSLTTMAILVAFGLVALGIVSPSRAARSVDLGVIVIMATSIALGNAVIASGLADRLAELVVSADALGDMGLLAITLIITMAMTELLSNSAAAALLLPIGLATAAQAGLDPRPFAVVVLVGASSSFLSPIGYQTNTMVYGMGGYRFTDFARLGFPVSIATFVVTITLTPLFFPLS